MAFDKRILQRIRIPLGFLFAIIFLIFARPTIWSLIIGSAIAAIGLGIRAWASGHIRKGRLLATSGPYAFTRNPLYLGSFVLGVGFTVASGVWWLGLIFCALFLGIYWPVMRVEAGDMHQTFGEEFARYERNVPMFIPWRRVWHRTDEKFDYQLYLQYREYRAALGAAAAVGALTLKAIFLR